MKTLRLLALSLLASASLRAAETLPVFNAIMTMGKEHRFVLVSGVGKSSSWLRVGATFDGYVLKAYDEKSGVLELERDGKVTRVNLVADAAIQSSGAAAMPSTPATLADAEETLRVMHFDEMMAKIVEQQKKAMAPLMQQMAARMKVPEEDRAGFLALQQKILDETMNSLTGPEMKADLAKIYSGVFSKEELAAQAAFYSTPAGQAMVAKQPQIQEQMMQVMMPRMTAIGPKMQQLAQDYAKDRASKTGAATSTPAAPTAPAGKP